MNNSLTALCNHFHLTTVPFLTRTKRPFGYREFATNLSLLSSAFYVRQLVVVSAMPGTGKSSLLFYAVNDLDPSEFRVCHLELSNPNKKALYKNIAIKLGIHPAYNSDDIKLQIINFFAAENEQGKFNCLMIDEAHTLSIPLIDELRSFYDEGGNFTLILVGLPSLLSRTLSLFVNLPMKQRINQVIELSGLSPEESFNYIQHHLEIARAKQPIFDDACFPLIHSASGGIPRRINQICYTALLDAWSNEVHLITYDNLKAHIEHLPTLFDRPFHTEPVNDKLLF